MSDNIEKVREHLFQLQKQVRTAKGIVVLTTSNTAPALAIDKCIDLCNYLLGNNKEFEIEIAYAEEEDDDSTEFIEAEEE